ncbi:MAG: bis-aminopropyl spermidine synthase family protein, partial [Candidatus Thorarchaeota archaeon]
MTITESDTFSVNYETHLTGQTRYYEECTEYESDMRDYQVVSIDEDVVEWKMTQSYRYSDNDGNSHYEENDINFIVNSTDGSYLNTTYDAPDSFLEYYTFDNIWFQIDPEVETGSTVHILGYEYEVIGKNSVFVEMFRAVEVIEVRITNAYKEIFDPEYDNADSIIELYFDESYYFDPISGYFVMSIWEADCSTWDGDFHWSDTGTVTASSYVLTTDNIATTMRVVFIFLGILFCIGIVVVIKRGAEASWRKAAEKSIAIIAGTVSAPSVSKRAKGTPAPTLWNPLNLRYQQLVGNIIDSATVSLRSGVFVITEPDDRMAVVDTRSKVMQNLVFPFNENNIELLYKLALGVIPVDSSAYQDCISNLHGMDAFIEQAESPMNPDPHSIEVFSRIDNRSDGAYQSVVELMSRRKVLDYSLGQAPLSPSSHILKLNHVIRFEPSSVLLVGDDDLIAISLARIGMSVTVLEVDPYTCALISSISQQENLGIRVHQVDLRAPLPMDLAEGFDLFIADPDFTIEAFTLFLARGLSLLKDGGIGLINYQDTRGQKFKANHVVKLLELDLVEQKGETWAYTIVQNTIKTYHGSGKYRTVNYTKDVEL